LYLGPRLFRISAFDPLEVKEFINTAHRKILTLVVTKHSNLRQTAIDLEMVPIVEGLNASMDRRHPPFPERHLICLLA
jgi:hypothetical protein